jgi:hypothetical protein
MKSCCINFFIYKEPIKYISNRKKYTQLFTKLNTTPIKIIFYVPDIFKDECTSKLTDDEEYNIIYFSPISKLLFEDIYEYSNKYGELSFFIDNITNYEIKTTVSLDNNIFYNFHTDNNNRLHKLFYVKNNLDKTEINYLQEYCFFSSDSSDPKYSDKIVTNTIDLKYRLKYFDQIQFINPNISIKIYRLLLSKKYSDIIMMSNTINIKSDQYTWFINYIIAISYYNLDNYKKCMEYCNKCKSLSDHSHEVRYIISKIYYNNKEYNSSLNEVKKYIKRIIKNTGYINNINISKTQMHYHIILVLKNLNKKDDCIDIINWMLDNNMITDNLFNILSNQMETVSNFKYTTDYTFKENLITYSGIEHHLFFKNNLLCNKIHENQLEILDIASEKISNIDLNSTKHGGCLNYNDKSILYISSLHPLIINNVDLDNNTLQEFMKHDTPGTWKDYIITTNFIEVGTVYIALVKHDKSVKNLFKIIYLNKKTLEPLKMSGFIKLNFTLIRDIFISGNNLNIIVNIDAEFAWYSLNIIDLYLNHNLPIDYYNNININTKPIKLKININSDKFAVSESMFKEYLLTSDNPDDTIDINYKYYILSKNSHNSLIIDFVYNYYDIDNITKEYTVSFYDKNHNKELYTTLEGLNISICPSYKKAKYFIIDIHDLNKLTPDELSDIINNNTLIINLIEVEDITKQGSKYMENIHLNKLFLFNIAKDSEYMAFIYNKIIEDDQYSQRKDYMKLDKQNMYNYCSITKYIKEFIDSKNIYDTQYENDYNKFPYKLDLITNLHKKTDNLVIIEILRYILLNNQNINIVHNIPIDPLIIQLNILGNIVQLNNLKLNINPIQVILIVDSLETLQKVRHICDAKSLIFINNINKLIFTF